MKKADLKKVINDETVVAVAVGYQSKADFVPTTAHRAIVLATGQKRRVFSNSRADFGGHIAEDGVRVRFLDRMPNSVGVSRPIIGATTFGRRDEIDPNAGPNEGVVGSRAVLMPWRDYEPARDRVLAEKDATKNKLEAEKAAAEKAALALGGVCRSKWNEHAAKVTGYHVELSVDAATRLVERLGEKFA